jgi:hypothetical protein
VDFPTHFRPVIQQLGEAVTWVHGTGTGASTGTGTGLYRRPYQPPMLGGITVDASSPCLVVMSDEFPNVARGDVFTIRGTGFTVRTPKPDLVSGLTVLELEAP